MTQNELDNLVANATGEDLAEIRHRGFSLCEPLDLDGDSVRVELPPQTVDWDEVELHRNVALVEQPPKRCRYPAIRTRLFRAPCRAWQG